MKGTQRSGLVASLALMCAVSSCCLGPVVDPVALVSPHTRYKYEIEIRARINVYGGPCNPTCFPTRVNDSQWLYVNRLEGEIPAEELALTFERDKFDFPHSALRGKVTISGIQMTVELQTPHYQGNDIRHYHTYRYNGTFDLRPRPGG